MTESFRQQSNPIIAGVNKTLVRTDIERALDEIISNEEGMKFQGLAVILAKQKWPDLIACERHNDLGLDAYAPASLAADKAGKGLACSTTPTLSKIQRDARRASEHFSDINIFIFATPQKVTNQTAQAWAKEIWGEFQFELIVMPREEILTSLMDPKNVSLCRTQLGISVPIEAVTEELGSRVLMATSELAGNWLKHPRIAGKPLMALRFTKPALEESRPDETLALEDIQTLLTECRRVVLEAPAGRGKTTTLIQLANLSQSSERLSFLIDLQEWAESGHDILDFIAELLEFRSRNVNASDLAQLSKAVHFSFLLNGWNEVTASNSQKAEIALRKLERHFPAAGIIVATRSHHLSPPLPGALRVSLTPLTRTQRRDYLQKRLGSQADELVSKLDNDRVLDDLTRTFLFLAEVATIFESGRSIPQTKMGVLGEVINLLEQSEEHINHLQRPPLRGRTSEYLAGLATQMTMQGATGVSRQAACNAFSFVSRELQIQPSPDSDDILNILCAHHILERLGSSEAFKFIHQQFQEFYAAGPLLRELVEIAQSSDQNQIHGFTKLYVNERSWDEPLRMVVEAIGAASATAESDAAKAGNLLIEMALSVDPIFAATLARLCGEIVWKQARVAVGKRLRAWYEVDDENHRQCALAGMFETGAEDFSDIILPLLTNNDQQVRLGAYRTGAAFYLSSLGAKWRDVVQGWKEEARSDFIHELAINRWMPLEAVTDFALSDPSPSVRLTALHSLSWYGADQELGRLLEALGDADFAEAIQELYVESIPASLKERARGVYQKLLSETVEPMSRIRVLLCLAELGDMETAKELKQELMGLQSTNISHLAEPVIKPALKLIQAIEPEWVSNWVATQITDGLLRWESWLSFVNSISEELKAKLLNNVELEELGHYRLSDLASILAATGDFSLVETVFAKLCDVRRELDMTSPPDNTKQEIARQLTKLIRSFPPNFAVAGLSNCFARKPDVTELAAVIEIFGGFEGDADLRNQLQVELRQSLRAYLKGCVQFVLKDDDPRGEIKARLATALATVGEPEDMLDLRRLIQADIQRIKSGLAARARGERSELAMGCAGRWDNWYVRAVAMLDAENAVTILIELLNETEYESESAAALVRLATVQDTRNRFSITKNYHSIWEARAGRSPRQFDEERRQRYTDAIKLRITMLLEERTTNTQGTSSFNHRLKELAAHLAALDSHGSTGLVLEVVTVPCASNPWRGVEAIENLLLGGATLPTDATLTVLNSVMERLLAQGFYNDQSVWLLERCLCLLPFLDDPSAGINRLRQALSETKFPTYKLDEIVSALGSSRCSEALTLLRELALLCRDDQPRLREEWLNAVAAFDNQEATQLLLSFIEPDTEGAGFEVDADSMHGRQLATHIAGLAFTQPAILQRIYDLCESQSSRSKRELLAKVIAQLGTTDAILAGLKLIDDAAKSPIPFDLQQALETIFLERHPHTGNSYTLMFRNSNEMRRKLFEMSLQDDKRRQSAFKLLGQIEAWRLEYGKPGAEPRHPAFDSGEL